MLLLPAIENQVRVFVVSRHTDEIVARGRVRGCRQLLKLAMCNLLYSRRGRIRPPAPTLCSCQGADDPLACAVELTAGLTRL